MIDIIDQIDEATSSVCGWCSAKLTEHNRSGDFCNEEHQAKWHQSTAEVRTRDEPNHAVVTVEVDTRGFNASMERARTELERFHRVLERAARQAAQAFGVPEELLGISSHDEPTRAERMRAALEARRHRNTGPAVPISIPKRLDGKGRR